MSDFQRDRKEMQSAIDFLHVKNLLDVVVNYLMVVDIPIAEAKTRIEDYMKKTKFSVKMGDVFQMEISLKDKLVLFLVKIKCYWMIKLMCTIKKII